MIEVDWQTGEPSVEDVDGYLATPFLVLVGKTGDIFIDWWANQYKDGYGNIVNKWHWIHHTKDELAAWAELTDEIYGKLQEELNK